MWIIRQGKNYYFDGYSIRDIIQGGIQARPYKRVPGAISLPHLMRHERILIYNNFIIT